MPGNSLRISAHDVAGLIIDAALTSQRPYAVFVCRTVEWMPTDGKRFAKLERDPVRMAQLVGVYTGKSALPDLEADLLDAEAMCS